jgi:VWFA-related protein
MLIKSKATLLLLVTLGFQPPHSAAQISENQEAMQHDVSVTLKLVQVYVTDKKGNPILDLEKEDFTISDNGKKKSLTEFERHTLQLLPSETGGQHEGIPENEPPVPVELMRRKFFLIFDYAYNNAKGILKAKKSALDFIGNRIQPADEVGVLSYSTLKSLKLHEYLTTDHEKLQDVVEGFDMQSKKGRAESFEDQYWYQATGENPLDASKAGKPSFRLEEEDPSFDPDLGSNKFSAQQDSVSYALHFIEKMKDFAKALRYIPGYKHIILFSSGIPYSIIYGIHQSPDSWNTTRGEDTMLQQGWDQGNMLLQIKYDEMLQELTASNTTIFSMDTEDLGSTIGMNSRLTGGFSLQTMATSTGGKYFGDINSADEHLETIQNLTGCYYVLGYYVDEEWDGKYHELKVKVNRKGSKVHAQKGYFNPKPFSNYSRLEKMLHLVDLALSDQPFFQVPVRFPLAALPYSTQGRSFLDLYAKLPIEKIREFLGRDIESVSIIFNKQNDIVKMERERKDFSKLPVGNIYYSTLLSLDPGDYQCRLVLRNMETGRGAVASAAVTVPERPDHGIKLNPPLLLKPETDSLYLKKTTADYSSQSSLYFPVAEPLDQGTNHILALVR